MKTEFRTTYKCNLDDWQLGWWNMETEEFVPFGDSEEEHNAAAETLGVSVELIEMLQMSMDELRDLVRGDLVDIWKRLDALEKEIRGRPRGVDLRAI